MCIKYIRFGILGVRWLHRPDYTPPYMWPILDINNGSEASRFSNTTFTSGYPSMGDKREFNKGR